MLQTASQIQANPSLDHAYVAGGSPAYPASDPAVLQKMFNDHELVAQSLPMDTSFLGALKSRTFANSLDCSYIECSLLQRLDFIAVRDKSYWHQMISGGTMFFACILVVLFFFLIWRETTKVRTPAISEGEETPLVEANEDPRQRETGVLHFFRSAFSFKSILFVFFIVLGAAHNLMPHFTRSMNYNFLCPIIVTSVLKIIGSLALHVFEDGRSMSEVLPTFRDEYVVMLKYSLQSALYGTYDVLSFVSLSHVDPSTYVIVMQFRLVVTGIVWELGFKKAMSQEKRVAILLITIACCCKQFYSSSTNAAEWSILLVLFVQMLSGCLATVANEILLKRETQVSMNLQNIAQYTWTLVWTLLIGVISIPMKIDRLSLNPLDLSEWAKMIDARMLPSIAILTINGLVVARVLCYLSSLWKAIGDVMKVLVCTGVSSLIWGYPITFTDGISFAVVAVGIFLFSQGAIWTKR